MAENLEEYWRSRQHRRHTPGCPQAPEWGHYMALPGKELARVSNRLKYCGWMDKAWTVMLHKQGLITHQVAKDLLTALADAGQEKGFGGEDWLKKKLGGDEDTASAVNLGRTLQEPMARMQLRDKLLDVFEELHHAMAAMLDIAERNPDTVMSGQSHWAHAQPTTYGAYMLTVHDGLARGLEQLELAYKHTNQNSGGCGACSGTGWPVDRHLVTELLGFDELIELAYDCEASQDEILTILFALSNLMVTVSRTCMDHNVWVLEELDLFIMPPQWRGVSSFMPQKANAGNMFEYIRIECDNVIGRMMTATLTFKGEPIQDILPVYHAPQHALDGLCRAEKTLGLFASVMPCIEPNKEALWQVVRNGFSGAPDLAIKLIRDKGYGARQAHRICCNFVRVARERGIKPYDTTGELLDEAARISDEPEPHLPTDEVQDAMGLESFLDKHCNVGDPCPSETRRMVGLRRTALDDARARQAERKARIEQANARLAAEIQAIVEA